MIVDEAGLNPGYSFPAAAWGKLLLDLTQADFVAFIEYRNQDAVKLYSKRRNFINLIRIAVFGWLIIVTSFASACRRTPPGDSEAGRTAEAKKFITTLDLRTLVDDLADNNVAARPKMDKDSFRAF